MQIAIGADHGGLELKQRLVKMLQGIGHDLLDVGTHTSQSCDYPLFGDRVATAVSLGAVERGILICKSGVGMTIVANKLPGVRAGLCRTVNDAVTSREHNDANVMVLGTNDTGPRTAQSMLKAWLATPFAGGRHARRVQQITRLERRTMKAVAKRAWQQ